MKACVKVFLKNGVLDPQGKAVLNAAHALQFDLVTDVRVGKFFEIELAAASDELLQQQLNGLAEQLLANPIIENFKVELEK